MPTKSITEVVGLVNGVVAPFQLSPPTQLQKETGTAFRLPPEADDSLPAPPEFRPRGPQIKTAVGDKGSKDNDKDKKDKPKGPPGRR